MNTPDPGDTVRALRAWARGLYTSEAAVELLTRAFGGRFARPGQPWVVAVADGYALDSEALAAAVEGPYSSGERRLLGVAASLAGGPPVDLSDAVSGLDRTHTGLVLAGIAHANGSHEHTTITTDDTGQVSFQRQPPLFPWPGPTHTPGTKTHDTSTGRESTREAADLDTTTPAAHQGRHQDGAAAWGWRETDYLEDGETSQAEHGDQAQFEDGTSWT
jgi:hypothetical protein